MPRMKILNRIEQEAFESPPLFNSAERKRHFDFPVAIQQIAAELRTSTNRLCFRLSCGYFKATHRFYPIQSFRPRDISHVAERTGIRIETVRLAEYHKQTSAYKLTLMKKLSQSTKPSKVKERAGDLALVERLYQLLKPVLDELALNQDGIQYYTRSVIKAQIFQLTRRQEKDRYLHLLAFIVHQYHRLQDNLVDVLLSSLQSFQIGALREHKEQCYVRRELRNKSLKALIGCVDMGLVKTLAAIAILTEDNALPDGEKVQRIRALLSTEEAKRLLEKDDLAELDEALSRQYVITNTNIDEGKNPHIKFKNTGFTLSTPTQAESDAEPLQQFFPERHYLPFLEILATVNRYSRWMEELQHWQQRHHHGRPSEQTVYAGVIGIGCAIGIRKMDRISHPISESALEHTVNWYFSLDNLLAANDRVLEFMHRLELLNLMRRSPDRLHTSSDGQKFEVRAESLNANYSYKYFGKGQGVSAYTFRDERDLLWYSLVFSSADRESAYVIDGLMHNDVVQSDIHSKRSA